MYSSHDIAVADHRSEILTWLSPLEPHLRHNDIRKNRVMGVGDWLFCTEEFHSWKNGNGQGESQKAAIFCSGNPGVGKTYISSLVIDIFCDNPGEAGEDNAVACFYFDSGAQKEQSAMNVLGALLKQVVSSLDQIPEEITDEFRRHKKFIGGRDLQLSEIVMMLGSVSSTQRTFLFLDALDECAGPDRDKVLLSLKDIIEMSPTTRVFLTGRPYVGDEVAKHFPEGTTLLSISPPTEDIIRYIRAKLAEGISSGEMDLELESEILEEIPENASEIFRLVSLSLDAILQETRIHRRRERLRVMIDGSGLEDTYGATLDRIEAQEVHKSRLGKTALMWICHSERQLRTEELCRALGVEIGSTDYHASHAPLIQTVLSYCQGFVVVDEGRSTVRLFHHTLREYLVNHRRLFQSPHATIAETCLSYLNSQAVMSYSGPASLCIVYEPFLEYSALYWGTHIKNQLTDVGKALALKLFSRYECHRSIGPLLQHMLNRFPTLYFARFRKFTGLHFASAFGLVEIVRALTMIDGVDVNGEDEIGATPLLWAAMKGHEAVVELLLERKEVDPDRPEDEGRTPISWAAGNGHGAVVKLLLGRKDVNPDRPDSRDRAPISWAAENGHEAVVKVLLHRKDVDPNRADCIHQTPISLASESGHEAVVRLFLGRKDIDPDWPDSSGRAPISWAAANGDKAVVKLLLARKKVNPDRPDDDGRTPISWAAGNGHEAVVKLLLGRKDIDPHRPDSYGRQPISWASYNGNEAVVQLLLGRADVNSDGPDRAGRALFSIAGMNDYEEELRI